MNMYKITDKNGRTLCFQVGENEKAAIKSAKDYHGHSRATKAEFVRKQD